MEILEASKQAPEHRVTPLARGTSKVALLASVVAAAVACASPPTKPRNLVEVRAAYDRAAADPVIRANAAVSLFQASRSVEAAEREFARDAKSSEAEHLSEIAAVRVSVAEAEATARAAREEVNTLKKVLIEERNRVAEYQVRGELSEAKQQVARSASEVATLRGELDRSRNDANRLSDAAQAQLQSALSVPRYGYAPPPVSAAPPGYYAAPYPAPAYPTAAYPAPAPAPGYAAPPAPAYAQPAYDPAADQLLRNREVAAAAAELRLREREVASDEALRTLERERARYEAERRAVELQLNNEAARLRIGTLEEAKRFSDSRLQSLQSEQDASTRQVSELETAAREADERVRQLEARNQQERDRIRRMIEPESTRAAAPQER